MRVDVLSEVVIDRPLDVVANYAVDPTNAPEWYVTSPRPTAGVHLRGGPARAGQAPRHADVARSFPDGGLIHVGG